jgi:hypothetical protein
MNINICDLVDAPVILRKPEAFPDETSLAKYTFETRNIFPPENSGLITFLLRYLASASRRKDCPEQSD